MFTSLSTGALRISVPFDEALDLAAGNAFAGLDFSTAELLALAEQSSVQDVKDRFSAAGLRPGAWSLPVNLRGDEQSYRAGLQDLARHAALAQALGSPWCATVVMPFSDELDFAANMERHVTRLRPVAQTLLDYDCRLGLEFIGPATLRAGHAHEFVYTMDGALDLGERIGTGNVGLLLDCFHWYTAHGTVVDLARLHKEQVVYVHVNDAVAGREVDEQLDQERMLPGASGLIDLTGFLQALQRLGYDGPVAVEPFSAEVTALPPAGRARAAAESLARVWAQAGL